MSDRVVIMGAAGRDFHNFNAYFRDNPDYEVVAFTATQIPNIHERRYPPELAGERYPDGIPIYPEAELTDLIRDQAVDQVVFAYSDVSHPYVMHKASQVLAAGADFRLMGAESTMFESSKPVVAICAVRTGAGKSQTTRHVSDVLRGMGRQVVVVRHPMPYGDLAAQAVQRFATYEDMDRHNCTIEEREEYEPHIDRDTVVYAGVDYEPILRQAEAEADVVVWDGGNNDLPFYKPDLLIVMADPHRPGHEMSYHPGEANLRLADVVVINKVDTASPEGIAEIREQLETSDAAKKQAEESLSQAEAKMAALEKEEASIAEDAEAQKERMLEELNGQTEQMLTGLEADAELRKKLAAQEAAMTLKRELVEKAIANVEQKLAETRSEERQRLMIKQFMEGLDNASVESGK